MIGVVLRQVRIHQWSKNVLLAMPLILAHRTDDVNAWMQLLWAFVAFSLAASAVYVLNDVADRHADRLHPIKKYRPIAAGVISIPMAYALAAVLVAVSGIIAVVCCTPDFLKWLTVYFVLTVAYSYGLRRVVLIDVILLGVLYALRVIAGGATVQVELSPWLYAFSFFLFTSFAFIKRFTELQSAIGREGGTQSGRAYKVSDAGIILIFGPALSTLAVLVFVLYLQSPEVLKLYTHPDRLWAIAPLLLYWVAHLWLSAHRGDVHEDPVIFALQDVPSYAVAVCLGLILFWASV